MINVAIWKLKSVQLISCHKEVAALPLFFLVFLGIHFLFVNLYFLWVWIGNAAREDCCYRV